MVSTIRQRMRLSIVDLSPILPGESRHDAFMHSVELARHAEALGYRRFWVAEHHGGAIGAGRAPEVLLAALGAHTSRIREPYVPGTGVPPRFIGGTPDQVAGVLQALARDLALEEIMIQDLMTEHQARLRSYQLLADTLMDA